jgi:hypothetical protein
MAPMSVAVLVPYRPADEARVANFERTRKQWDDLGWPVFAGDHEGEPFCRSRAINAAAARTDADVLFVADCDILLDLPAQAGKAAALASEFGAYVVAYSVLHVLDEEGTEIMRDDGWPPERMVVESPSLIWGNAFAVPRSLFELVGGFDERFVGWGAEDVAFLVACSTLGGAKQRIYGDAYHLTHPEPDKSRLEENNRLGGRYRAADGDAAAVRALLAERT